MSRDEENESTPEEKARAHRLARLVDDMLAGEPAPPALEAEDRALLETATAIHAAMGKSAPLEPAETSRLVESAFAGPAPLSPPRRGWLRRRGPWMVAAMSAAVAIVFVLADPVRKQEAPPAAKAARPTPDQLVGRIDEKDSGDASRRLDVLYADRLTGYRSVKLGGEP